MVKKVALSLLLTTLNRTSISLLILVLLIAIGFTIRTSGIFSNMILFLFDNARDLLYVKKIVVDHDLILIGPSSGGLQGYFHGVLWYYLLSIPFFLGKGNPQTFTLFMAICSSFSIVLAFVLVKKIAGFSGALIASCIYTFAYFSVQTSRFIWNPYPIVWIMPLFVYSLYVYIIKRFYVIGLSILSLTTAFIFHFEAIYGICLIPIVIGFTIHYFLQQEYLRTKIKTLIIILFLFTVPLVPSILFDLKHDFLISKSILTAIQTGGANITHDDKVDKILPLLERIPLRFHDLINLSVHSISKNQLLNNIFFIFVPISIFIAYRRKDIKWVLFFTTLVITIVIPFFFFLQLKYAVWEYYWMGNPPLYSLLLAISIGYIYQRYNKVVYITIPLILILLYTYNPVNTFTNWQKGEIKEGSQTLKTQIHVINTIYKDADNQPFSVYVSTPPVYDYVYRYLLWWKGKTQFNKYPFDNKQEIFYLILEPNPDDLKHKFFKDKVIRTNGKVEQTLTFPDNLKVEKIRKSLHENDVDPNYFPQL